MKIAVIIPTFNSKNTIVHTLDSILGQSAGIDEIIIIDNCSKDNTVDILREKFPDITLILNTSNRGASGGYCAGLEYACKKGHDWVWLLDADSLPSRNALAELVAVTGSGGNPGAVASLLIDDNSGLVYQPLYWMDRWVNAMEGNVSAEPFPVDCNAFSGLMVSKEVIRTIGFPREDFFMDIADWEYCLRIRQQFRIIVVPKSRIFHTVGRAKVVPFFWEKNLHKLENDNIIIQKDKRILLITHPAWRYYYRVRNDIFISFHEFRTLSAAIFGLVRFIKICSGIIIYEDNKINKLAMSFLGLSHGVKKKLGITVKPG